MKKKNENTTKKTKCVYCGKEIDEDIVICPDCGSYYPSKHKLQRLFFGIGCIIKFIIPIMIIAITIYQLKLACNEKSEASEAKNIAKETREDLDNRIKDIKIFQANQLNIDEHSTFIFITTTEGDYISLYKFFILKSSDYGIAYMNTNWLYLNTNSKELISNNSLQRYYFDLFEISFFNWYLETHRGNWYVDISPYRNVLGRGGRLSYTLEKPDSLNSTIISSEVIRNQLEKNICLPSLESSIGTWILPPNSTFKTYREFVPDTMPYDHLVEKHEREIVINNEHVKFTICIENDMIYSEIRDLDLKALGIDKYLQRNKTYRLQTIIITFNAEFKAESLTAQSYKQHEWIKQMIFLFKREYDWNLFKGEL